MNVKRYFDLAYRIARNRLGVKRFPSFITFLVTWRCNQKCAMCDIWKKKPSAELDTGGIEAVFRQLKPVDAIRITGGEPFMRSDISEIVNLAGRILSPAVIHLTTNGSLTERIAGSVRKIDPALAPGVHVKISIDGTEQIHDRIRGVKGAYKSALATVRELSGLRKETGFFLGVNQTITDEESARSYFRLKEILKKYGVSVYPTVAYKKETALYKDKKNFISPGLTYRPYGEFSGDFLENFLKTLMKDASGLGDFAERAAKKYYLKGVYNRLLNKKNSPSPRCAALTDHLRILPDGDVPVCLYNSAVIGNLRKEPFRELWFGERIEKYRKWVRACPGCWAGCECMVSGFYSGSLPASLAF